MGAKQLGFGDDEQSIAKNRTKRESFLAEMNAVVPWKALIDPAMEDALSEVPAMRRFAGSCSVEAGGYDLVSERIQDETTILAFGTRWRSNTWASRCSRW